MTAVGLFAGLTVIVVSIFIGADYSVTGVVDFFDAASVFVVVGGMLCALAVNFNMKELKSLGGLFKQTFYESDSGLVELIATFTNLAGKARREGLLALE